jgi:hypothetical protein
MASYRCYFMNSGGHIVGLKDMAECIDDTEARRSAITLLNEEPRYSGVSLWDGRRKVLAEFIPSGRDSGGVWPPEVAA